MIKKATKIFLSFLALALIFGCTHISIKNKPTLETQALKVVDQEKKYLASGNFSAIYSELISSKDRKYKTLSEYINENIKEFGNFSDVMKEILKRTEFEIEDVNTKNNTILVKRAMPDTSLIYENVDFRQENYEEQIKKLANILFTQAVIPTVSETITINYVMENNSLKLYKGWQKEAIKKRKEEEIIKKADQKRREDYLKKKKIEKEKREFILKINKLIEQKKYFSALIQIDKKLALFEPNFIKDNIIKPIEEIIFANINSNLLVAEKYCNALKNSKAYEKSKKKHYPSFIVDEEKYFIEDIVNNFDNHKYNNSLLEIKDFNIENIKKDYFKECHLTLYITNKSIKIIKGYKFHVLIKNNLGMVLLRRILFSDSSNIIPGSSSSPVWSFKEFTKPYENLSDKTKNNVKFYYLIKEVVFNQKI